MSYSYTKEQFLKDLKSIKSESLYKCNQVNYKGKTKNTKEYYTEVFAEYLLENIHLLLDLPTHKRKLKYRISTHPEREVPGEESNRHEEKIAIQLYRRFRDSEEGAPFGRVLDYQVPLKENRDDAAGKIDLLSVKGNEVMVLELKIPKSKETMLRCALEAYTYYKTVDSAKLLEEYHLTDDFKLVPSPLLFIGSDQQIEFESPDHSKLRELMSVLGIIPLFIPEDLSKR